MPSTKLLSALLCLLAFIVFPASAQTSSLPPTPPVKLAVNPITDKIYMANRDANTVSAYDAASGTSTTIPVGTAPSFIAVNPATNRVYVDNAGDATLSVIDGATDTLIATYDIGASGPITVNPVTNVVYVVRLTGLGSDEVTFFNGNTDTWYTIATNSFQPNAMAVDPVTDTIYVTHYGTGDVRVIGGAFDPANDFPASVSIGTGRHPYAIAFDAITRKGYIITEDASGPIMVLDGSDNSAVFPAVASGHATGPQSIAVNPVTNKVYAAFAGEVIVIDGATTSLTYVPIAGASSGSIALGIDYSTNRIYAAASSGTLSIIDGDSDTVVATRAIPVGTSSAGVNPLTGDAYFFDTTLDTVAGTGNAHAVPLTTTITPLSGDTSPPSGSITLDASNGFAPWSLPVRNVYYRLDGTSGPWTAASGTGPYTASFSNLAPGPHTLHAFAADGQDAPLATGPQSVPLLGQVASYTFTVPQPKVDPSISLASSKNPSVAGDVVTFTASVTGANGSASGSVTFSDGTSPLCADISLSSGTASCGTASLAIGTHAITARYSGDASYNAATSAALNQSVVAPKSAASASLSSSRNPSTPGQSVTFSVSVSGSVGTPTGTVAFLDGTSALAGCASVALTAGGATCSTASLASGSHSISASYSGDGAYNAATSNTVTQTVQAAASQFTLTVTKNGSGTVTSSPSGITCGTTCSASFASGSTVTLSAAADAGSSFAGWSGACSGTGSCTVTLDAAATVSASFTTSVTRLFGISTRGDVLTGDNVMIGGFIINGSTNKTVVIRARGPSLAQFGVPNPLANPTLTLVRSSDQSVIATNDDWQSAPNAAQVQASGFAPTDARESAILMTLPPGAYTAIVSGLNNTTGVGIIEVFEIDNPDSPLAGISTRGKVLTGDNVMIAGFIVQGSTPQTVLLRARGPSLAQFGVPSPLANPVLTLVRSSDQSVVGTNDDWQSAPNAAQIQASGMAPTDSRESAMLVTLDPGAYTAIVSGLNNTTGAAIVEVFNQ